MRTSENTARPWLTAVVLVGVCSGATGCFDVAAVAEGSDAAASGGAGGSGGVGTGATASSGGNAGGGGMTGGGGGGAAGSGGTSSGNLGSTCSTDADCGPGQFCENPAVFGGASGGKVCSIACCRSEDCAGPTNVCYPALSGGSVCLPASSVGRPVAGTGTVGGNCSTAADCRSALCANGKCFDTCCSDASCSGSDYCSKRTLPGTTRSVMACGASTGSGGYQASCSTDGQCASNICSSSLYCSKACCTSKDCAGTSNFVCLFNSGLRRCAFPGFQLGSTAYGGACAASSDCKTGRCVGPSGGPSYCTDTCCGNADCPAGFGCRVAQVGGATQLLCLKQ